MEQAEIPVHITAEPKKGQLVEHDGKIFKTIQEGRAFILVPPSARTSVDPQAKAKGKTDNDGSHVQSVFYNPIQQFNRDLSVLAIKAYAEDACERKRQRREVHRGKAQKKWERKQNKRKRTEDEEKNAGNENNEGGVKVRRVDEDLAFSAGVGEVGVKDSEEVNKILEVIPEEDGGVSVVENGRLVETVKNDKVAEPVVTDSGLSADSPALPNADQEIAAEAKEEQNNTVQAKESDGSQQPKEWQPTLRILDALSATGLRALRYASEIPHATSVTANDRDRNAVRNINLNVEHNELTSSIATTTGDAQGHMYRAAFPPSNAHGPQHQSGKYDVIDLDPYGTAAPFIDSALQALEDGGLLCVTCTDSGVFASCGYSEKTFSLYGGMPIKGLHSHEGGLRLIIHSIATRAATYGIAIEPLLSLSIDFYVRLFIRIHKSARDVKFLASKTMLVYGCDHGCGAWSSQFLGRHTKQSTNGKEVNYKYSIAQAPSADKKCEFCGSVMHVAGPMWGGPLHNPVFIERVLDDLETIDGEVYQTKNRVEGMLHTALDELVVNADAIDRQPTESAEGLIPESPPELLDHHPFFFIPSALCKVIKAAAPPENLVKGALRYAGYRATRSHCKGGSIKTDAPWSFIWEIMREWVRQKSPIKDGALKEGSPGWNIMQGMRKTEEDKEGLPRPEAQNEGGADQQPNGTSGHDTNAAPKRKEIVFDEKMGKDQPGKRLVRYQQNPRENWGPMTRAKGGG